MKKIFLFLSIATLMSCDPVLAQCDKNFGSHMFDGYNSKDGIYYDCDSLVDYAVNDNGLAYQIIVHDKTDATKADFTGWFIDKIIFPVTTSHIITECFRKICMNGDTSEWGYTYTSRVTCTPSSPPSGQTFAREEAKTLSSLTGTDSIKQGGQARVNFISVKAEKGALFYEGEGFTKTMALSINKGSNGVNISTLRMKKGKMRVAISVGNETVMKLISVQ